MILDGDEFSVFGTQPWREEGLTEAGSVLEPVPFKWMPKVVANDKEVDAGDCSTNLSIILDLPNKNC